MASLTSDPDLAGIEEKVRRQERLGADDALACLTTHDITGLGRLADLVRERRHGSRTYYRNDMNLNQTNACVLDCDLCAFYRPLGHEEVYEHSPEEMREKAERAIEAGVNEFHIVGGLHPELDVDYFCEVFEQIKAVDEDAFLQALTAVELDYVAKISGMTVEELLDDLVDAGLGSTPGGGAEIFHEEIRPRICDHKTDADRWLEIHRIVHDKGLASNATMLYGHYEEPRHVVDHMERIRDLQDETGGFEAFIPLAFNPEGTEMQDVSYATGFEDLRICATARVFLDNVPHIKLVWQTVGRKIAQVSQSFGVDDIGGTAFDERILWAAGQQHGKQLPEDELVKLIERADRDPVFTNSGYEDLSASGHPRARPVQGVLA